MPLILQPGCGSGRWLPYLRQISRARYVGFDFSPLLIRYARRTVQGSDAVFLHADMRSFPRLEPVDLILLDYEFLNAFNPNESQDGLRWAHATLKTGDIVIGDVRPRIATATTGSRQWTVAGKATDARLLWSERGVIGRRFFGSQRLSIDLRAMRIVQQQQQDLIWLLGERQRNALFSAQPWREVLLDDLGHIPH